jgi:hypothetical protein
VLCFINKWTFRNRETRSIGNLTFRPGETKVCSNIWTFDPESRPFSASTRRRCPRATSCHQLNTRSYFNFPWTSLKCSKLRTSLIDYHFVVNFFIPVYAYYLTIPTKCPEIRFVDLLVPHLPARSFRNGSSSVRNFYQLFLLQCTVHCSVSAALS